jgi:hypothetical protein
MILDNFIQEKEQLVEESLMRHLLDLSLEKMKIIILGLKLEHKQVQEISMQLDYLDNLMESIENLK